MVLDGAHKAESHARSFVKGISWRVIGTIDTFVWSLLITHKPFSALSIASLETVTKIILYYGHERLWRLVDWAPEGHLRALVKAVVWRIVGSLDTFFLSLLITHKLHYALSIAGIEALTKIFLYYLHERAWRVVSWGRTKPAVDSSAAAPTA